MKRSDAVHALRLKRIRKEVGCSGGPAPPVAQDQFRFVTVLHKLEPMVIGEALQTVTEFKQQLLSVIAQCRGIWCLGAVEVEVVSLDLMRQLADQYADTRKLDVCESMLKRLKKGQRGLPNYFLIHFHGIVATHRSVYFAGLSEQLKLRWNQESRQVQMKPLSTVFKGKPKTTEKNLVDIARYITKGGNDWIGGKSYLRYKLGFDTEHLETEEGWVNKNWRRNDLLRQEHMEEGLEDALSLTRGEIGDLAQVIDGMMGMNRSRTGYLVLAKSKRRGA